MLFWNVNANHISKQDLVSDMYMVHARWGGRETVNGQDMHAV